MSDIIDSICSQEVAQENTSSTQLKTTTITTNTPKEGETSKNSNGCNSNSALLSEQENKDGQEPQLVKKRRIVENQSSQDICSRESRIREINPESILDHLREIATYGERCQLSDEGERALEQVYEYKQNAHDLVINEELLQSTKEGHELTPVIFTKKSNNMARTSKNMHSWMIGFENYLNTVAQMYYKKNFNIREMVIIPGENKDVVVQNALSTAVNGEKKKRGRKNTQKTAANVKEGYSTGTNDDSSNKKSTTGNSNNTNHQGRRGRPSNHQEDKKSDQPQYNFSKEEIQLSILDHLINPLKTDYPFELWSPKEIAIFECAMCKFGKQFGFISALIGSKTHRDVFEFYLMWKGTSHYKIWKMHKNIGNRNNHSHLI